MSQQPSEETVPLHGLRPPATTAYPHSGSGYPSTPPPPPTPPSSPPRRSGGLAAGVLAGALVLGLVAGVGGAAAYERLRATSAPTSGEPVSVSSVAARVLPSVVKITAVTADGDGGTGSGSVISEDGEIVTNNHVVEIADTEDATLTVSFDDGTHAEAELVGRDPKTDLALIRVVDAEGLTPIPVADSTDAEVGQAVVAVGSPYGLDSTVTAGIISALHRPVVMDLEDGSGVSVYGAIQTDAPINPGNSGGALVTVDGELVGVNSVIRLASGSSDSEGDLGNIGIGYAIPTAAAMPILDQLRAGETPTHARLGVSPKDAEFSPGVPGGAEITDVSEDSAAESAGLEAGDVVTRIGDLQVGSWDALLAAVYAYRPGDTVTVTFDRDGEERTAEVTLGSDATD